jgi:hypothetical protein
MAAGMIQGYQATWEQAGGDGQARIVALSYFSLGEEHTEESLHNLRTYYGFLGEWVEGIAMGAPRTPAAVRERAAAFEELGCSTAGRPTPLRPSGHGPSSPRCWTPTSMP